MASKTEARNRKTGAVKAERPSDDKSDPIVSLADGKWAYVFTTVEVKGKPKSRTFHLSTSDPLFFELVRKEEAGALVARFAEVYPDSAWPSVLEALNTPVEEPAADE